MADRRKRGGDQTERRDHIGRYVREAAREHRVGRPHEGRHERRREAGRVGFGEPELGPARDQRDRAEEPDQRARDVMKPQPLLRQQTGEQHDQQRPKIVDEPGFGRRCKAERGEIQRVIAEQPANPKRPYFRRLAQRMHGMTANDPGCGPESAPDREADRGELERRHLPGGCGQQRQRRPHQHGRKADQRRGTAPREPAAGHRRRCQIMY